jgi:hypothetical protein
MPGVGAQSSIMLAGIAAMRLKSFHAVFPVPMFREALPSALARRGLKLARPSGLHQRQKCLGASRLNRLREAQRPLEAFKALQRLGSPVSGARKAVAAWAEADHMAVAVANGKGLYEKDVFISNRCFFTFLGGACGAAGTFFEF